MQTRLEQLWRLVKQTGRSAVRVYSGRALSGLLSAGAGELLSAQDVQRITHQIEQRCRTVVPTYRRDQPKPGKT